MAFQKVTDTVEIDHLFTLNGVGVQNTHYARLPSGYIQTDIQALADAIDLTFPAGQAANMPGEVTYVRTEVRGLAVENDITASQNLSSGPGTNGGTTLPNNVTFAIKKTSGLTGRSARGRIFQIGIPETEVKPSNENLLEAVYITAIVANLAFIRTTISSVGLWEPVIVSRFTDGALRPEGKTFPWTGETNVNDRVDTHRGRLPIV